MDEPRTDVPAECRCWMLRKEFPLPPICREFRAHPELTVHNQPECADCTHPEICHFAVLGREDEELDPIA